MNLHPSIANWGRITLGIFLAGLSGAKIVGAYMFGHTSVAMFRAGFAEQPIYFVGLIAVWLVIFAGGISHVKDGITGLRNHQGPALS
jgi:hypothetical protein